MVRLRLFPLFFLLTFLGGTVKAQQNAAPHLYAEEKKGDVSSEEKVEKSVAAHPPKRNGIQKTGRKIRQYGSVVSRFIRAFDDYDTTYITPNLYNYSFMVQNTNNFEFYQLRSDNKQSITFSPKPSFKIGPYFGWRWIFLGYTFAPSNFGNGRKSNKTEFELSLYSSMLGCDLLYRRTGDDFRISRVRGFGNEGRSVEGADFSGMRVNLTGINAYYIFNHKHFSYPAAFSQSTVQRKSCGTWKVGFAYTHHNINYQYQELPTEIRNNTEFPLAEDMKFQKIDYDDYSVSCGYAYNWVFRRNCLLSVSFSPAIGYKHTRGNYEDDEPVGGSKVLNWFSLNRFNIDCVGRAALVWNNTKYYGGASLVVHSYNYWKNSFSTSNTFGSVNVYIGLNFKKKKEYRNR